MIWRLDDDGDEDEELGLIGCLKRLLTFLLLHVFHVPCTRGLQGKQLTVYHGVFKIVISYMCKIRSRLTSEIDQ